MLIGVAAIAAVDPRSPSVAAGLAIGAGLFSLAAVVGTIEAPHAALAVIAVGVLAHLRGWWRTRRRPPIPPARAVPRR